MKNFNDKVVVLTGAGSGIGRALALQLAGEGARLALSDINRAALEETLACCRRATAHAATRSTCRRASRCSPMPTTCSATSAPCTW